MLRKKWNVIKNFCIALGVASLFAGASFPYKAYAAEDMEEPHVLEASATGVIASGTNKGNCKWSIDKNYGLTITGSKNAVLRGSDPKPWSDYKDKITSITIDVPAAKDLQEMFANYFQVKTVKIKIDKVEGSMESMLECNYGNSSLVSADLSGMNVSKVTSIKRLFLGCGNLLNVNVSNWDTSGIEDMNSVFDCCSNLKSVDISKWNTSKVTTMYGMFGGCKKLEKLDVSKWDTSNVTDVSLMFNFCKNLKFIDVSKWNTSKVKLMAATFQACESLEELDVSKWNTSNVIYMGYLFNECKKLKTLDVYKWNTSNVIAMENMFRQCSSLISLNLTNFNTGNVVEMGEMFSGCRAMKNLAIANFDTRRVTDMHGMFSECVSLTGLNLKKFNTSHVTLMNNMFEKCFSLTSLDLSSFDTSKVTDVRSMFGGCIKLKSLDLSKFVLNNVVIVNNMEGFMDGCYALESLRTPKYVYQDYELDKIVGDGLVWYRDDTNIKIDKMPKKSNVSLKLHLQEKGNKIVDVRTSGWEYDAVKYVTDEKIMNGVGTTDDFYKYIIFKGNDTLTRGMFVTVLFNKENPKVTSKMTNPFKDVKKTDYFYNAVRWANNNKIVNGTSSKTFSPNESIKRQDMVVIMYKYAQSKGKKYISITKNYNINSFKDHNKVDQYAVTAMTWATCHKIISGKPIKGTKNYNLDPQGFASRAECAQILLNFDNYMKTIK